jgi:hypothetical protein
VRVSLGKPRTTTLRKTRIYKKATDACPRGCEQPCARPDSDANDEMLRYWTRVMDAAGAMLFGRQERT